MLYLFVGMVNLIFAHVDILGLTTQGFK